jgi:hypothetical protein
VPIGMSGIPPTLTTGTLGGDVSGYPFPPNGCSRDGAARNTALRVDRHTQSPDQAQFRCIGGGYVGLAGTIAAGAIALTAAVSQPDAVGGFA